TASIVASRGWIIPAPLAIPPTPKPSREASVVFGPSCVVIIASAPGGRRRDHARARRGRAAGGGERDGGLVAACEQLPHREPRADHAGREDDDLWAPEPERCRSVGGGPLWRRVHCPAAL